MDILFTTQFLEHMWQNSGDGSLGNVETWVLTREECMLKTCVDTCSTMQSTWDGSHDSIVSSSSSCVSVCVLLRSSGKQEEILPFPSKLCGK